MKKRFILGLAALAALALTGCQKDLVVNQVPEETPIAFGTYLGRDAATKAEVLTTETLKTSGFGVYAYYSNGVLVPNGSLVPNFMKNQLVKYDNTVGVQRWTYTPLKYWPQEPYKISFFAYAPYLSSITYEAHSTTGEPIITVSKGTDYTYAEDGSGHSTPTLLNLTSLSPTLVDSKVKLNFKHAMSKVGLSIKAADQPGSSLDESTSITINSLSITFTNIFNTAKLNLGTGEISGVDTDKSSITYSFTDTDFTNSGVLTKTNAILNNIDSEYLMMVPQTSIPLSITVDYTISTTDSNLPAGSQTISFTYNTSTSGSNTITLEKGNAYNLVLTLGLNSIQFDAVVTEWGTPSDVTLSI